MSDRKSTYLEKCNCYDNKLNWSIEKGEYNINTIKEFETFCYNKIKEDYKFAYKIETTEDSIKIYYGEYNSSPSVPDVEFVTTTDYRTGFNLFIFGITWHDAISGLHTFDE